VNERDFALLVESILGRDLTLRGFRPVKSEATKVRYESPRVYLEFINDQREGDLGLYFGPLGLSERFQFLLYMRSVAPAHPAAGGRVVDSPADVETELKGIADALKRYGEPILSGDDSLLERMKTVRWWDSDPKAVRDQ
jgi:hypothetical protein